MHESHRSWPLFVLFVFLAGCGKSAGPESPIQRNEKPTIFASLQVTASSLPAFDANGTSLGDLEEDTLLLVGLTAASADAALASSNSDSITRPEQILAREVVSGFITATLVHQVRLLNRTMPAGAALRIPIDFITKEEQPVSIAGFEGFDADRVAALNARLFRATRQQTVEADETEDPYDALSMEELEDVFRSGSLGNEPDVEDSTLADSSYSAPVCQCRSGTCRISSKYGPRDSSRTTNGNRMSSFHRGLDVSDYGNAGAAIVAAKAGCIVRVLTNRASGYGLTVYLRHNDGVQTQSSHMSRFVRTSGCVAKGATLGYMGSTGNVTGPHLHLGTLVNGAYVNPERFYSLAKILAGSKKACQ